MILHGVDAVMPDQAHLFYNRLRDTIAGGEFPNVFGDLTPAGAREVPAPEPARVGLPAVVIARQSVVKLTGGAPSCKRRIEGSYEPSYVRFDRLRPVSATDRARPACPTCTHTCWQTTRHALTNLPGQDKLGNPNLRELRLMSTQDRPFISVSSHVSIRWS